MTFRVLDSRRAYVLWMETEEGPAPPVRKTAKVDQLVQVEGSSRVFLRYIAERMDQWIPHWTVEDHQLRVRARNVAAVSAAPAGERLEILIDWSEKLSLEPNNSTTAGKYPKMGLCVAVCVYRGDDNEPAKCETLAGMFEAPTNDVPHTHAFLREILKHFVLRSRSMGRGLQEVNVWSDGGQAHFKCAEALVYLSHLVREFREATDNSSAQLTWNYMQSYHGKGPYDAEV